MNPHFERSGIYPFATVPAGGYLPTASGEQVIVNINHQDKAVKVLPDNKFEYVTLDEATLFPDSVSATLAAAQLL